MPTRIGTCVHRPKRPPRNKPMSASITLQLVVQITNEAEGPALACLD
jgi:hypothetical protein